jgi:N-methylhydantoinase B/oxoprolinase/acetone carboxylase alpha subunit
MDFTEDNLQRLGVTSGSSNCAKGTVTRPGQGRDAREEQLQEPDRQKPRVINIGGKATVLMGKGDRLVIETPGGGGWGTPKLVESKA